MKLSWCERLFNQMRYFDRDIWLDLEKTIFKLVQNLKFRHLYLRVGDRCFISLNNFVSTKYFSFVLTVKEGLSKD